MLFLCHFNKGDLESRNYLLPFTPFSILEAIWHWRPQDHEGPQTPKPPQDVDKDDNTARNPNS